MRKTTAPTISSVGSLARSMFWCNFMFQSKFSVSSFVCGSLILDDLL